jgi:hypothetical protein
MYDRFVYVFRAPREKLAHVRAEATAVTASRLALAL